MIKITTKTISELLYEKMGYCSRSHDSLQAREKEMSTDPDPKNVFWVFVQKLVHLFLIALHK